MNNSYAHSVCSTHSWITLFRYNCDDLAYNCKDQEEAGHYLSHVCTRISYILQQRGTDLPTWSGEKKRLVVETVETCKSLLAGTEQPATPITKWSGSSRNRKCLCKPCTGKSCPPKWETSGGPGKNILKASASSSMRTSCHLLSMLLHTTALASGDTEGAVRSSSGI